MSVLDWMARFRSRTADVRPTFARESTPHVGKMTGKYVLLYDYLENRHANTVVLTFAEIEDLIGSQLPEQARGQREWWTDAGASIDASRHSDAWTLASRTALPNLVARTVVFDRAS